MAERPSSGYRLIGPIAFACLAAITALAFGRVFAGSGTTLKLLLAGLVSAALAGSLERRSLWLSAIASVAALGLVIGWTVFPQTLRFGLPTTATLSAIAHAARLVGTDANVQTAPAAALPPLVMAAEVAVWAATFSAHSLGMRSGSPVLSLVPPVALVAFADTVLNAHFGVLYGALFLCGGLAIVYADGLRRVERWGPMWSWPRSKKRTPISTARGVRRVGAAAVGTALVAPLILPGFGTKAVIDFSSHGTSHVQIDPLVSIGAALGPHAPVDVLTVTAPFRSYLRITSLDYYDGVHWRPQVHPQIDVRGPFTDLAPKPAGVRVGPSVDETVRLVNDLSYSWLPASWLPAPSPAEHLTSSLPVRYDPQTQTLVGPAEISKGTSYEVQTETVSPTRAQLNDTPYPISGSVPSPQDLYLPQGLPIQLPEIARRWAKGQATEYGVVASILQRLSSDPFYYSLKVAPRDDQTAIVDFLTNTHAGFCQQFAGSMAVLLRELKIPARVAVGFDSQGAEITPPSGSTQLATYELTTQQLHAWVEVYFPDAGWIPFDPTPHHSDPAAASYAGPRAIACQLTAGCGTSSGSHPGGRSNVVQSNRHPVGQGGATNERGTGGAGPTFASRTVSRLPSAGQILFFAALAGLAFLLIVPLWRVMARRIRLRRAKSEPRKLVLATFSVFAARAADLGLGRLPYETPREYGARLSSAGPLRDAEVQAFTTLAARAAYEGGAIEEHDARFAGDSCERMIRELRRSTPVSRRATGLYRREGVAMWEGRAR